ncbi:uncharacterized mitochondrial protein AtMg00820-like [Humulus lupulus]|uniref:uncharacterized mitochondrial protein AtMg00820-like n=1 Tax=Humulus lupulus TaxID=3486 RepID=UPI002B40A3E2|nr:uncharacterized mitochondrial protein AtMg00820-like [Humulus lupulus]
MPNLAYLHVFGCECYILNDREKLGKLDAKSDEGVFLGYSSNSCAYVEPKSAKEAFKYEHWIFFMQDELHQFERNKVWTLISRPLGANIIGTKWMFRNKTDEVGNFVRNKAILVAQWYTQIEGVDFEETFASVARLESIRLLLAVACFMKFKLYQMDVNNVFLNDILVEEAYVSTSWV